MAINNEKRIAIPIEMASRRLCNYNCSIVASFTQINFPIYLIFSPGPPNAGADGQKGASHESVIALLNECSVHECTD